MANPQPDQHTRISNELLEALAKVNFSAYEIRLLIAIIRKTYGWQKKTDHISISQLMEITHLDRRAVSKFKLRLIKRNIVYIDDSGMIGLNKDYDKWLSCNGTTPISIKNGKYHQEGVSCDGTIGVSSNGTIADKQGVSCNDTTELSCNGTTELSCNYTTTKEILKENIKKVSAQSSKRKIAYELFMQKLRKENPEAIKLVTFFVMTMDEDEKRFLPEEDNYLLKTRWYNTIKKAHEKYKFEYWKIFDIFYYVRVDFEETTKGFSWKKNFQTPIKLLDRSRSQGVLFLNWIWMEIRGKVSAPKNMTDMEYITGEIEAYAKEKNK